ncbi:MAG: FAD-binding protein [Firmicutes bacterium]|nr:FAD-binding protein [Bacillota bacterium]
MPDVSPEPEEEALQAELAEQNRILHHHILAQRQLMPQGMGHRLYGTSATPLPLQRPRILFYHPANLVVTASAGLSLSDLHRALAPYRQWLPLVPWDGQEDTLGGAVAAALEGPYRGYGSFRDRVIGLSVVIPALGPVNLGARVVKNVAGYNVLRLLWGSRGTLGVITAVTVKVSPWPEWQGMWQIPVAPDSWRETLETFKTFAATWAALSLSRESGRLTLYAVAHGRPSLASAFVDRLGPPSGTAIPPLSSGAPIIVAGAVTRSIMPEFLQCWPSSAPVRVEAQSGAFFGYLHDGQEYQALARWLADRQGSLRVLRDPEAATPPPLVRDRWWASLKALWDPDGCLWDPRKEG